MYIPFDKYTDEHHAQEVKRCFHYGVINERVPQSILDSHTVHRKNAGALEQTLVIFNDMPDKRPMIVMLKKRLEQERLWIKHYEACFAAHKKGRDQIAKSTQGFSLTFIASQIEAEETRKKPAKELRDKPNPWKKPEEKTDDEKKQEQAKMTLKAIAPEKPKEPQKKRFFAVVKKKDKQGNEQRSEAA